MVWGQIELLNTFQFLTAKPMIYLVNLSEKSYVKKASKWCVAGHSSSSSSSRPPARHALAAH